MPLFSSLSKNLLPFLVLTVLWLMMVVTFSDASFATMDNLSRAQMVGTILLGEGVLMAIVHWMENRHTARREHAKLLAKIAPARVALYEHLTQLPFFDLYQWCVLPSSREARALAVNGDGTRITLLDYQLSTDRRESTPVITVKMFEVGDVESVALEEIILGGSRTPLHLFSEDKAPVHLASELLGAAGLPISNPQLLGQSESGQESAQARRAAPIASPDPIPAEQNRRLNRLRLKVKRSNSTESVNYFYFLVGEVTPSDEAYLFARENAEHWQLLFEGLRSRGGA